NRALSIYANKHSADVQETLVDTKVLVDSGVLAKPFKEQFEEVKQVVERLADMTDNFTEVPASEAKQEEMFNLMRTYSTGMSKLKQYDPDVVNGEDIGFDYDNPDELVTLLGMTPEQEEMLTTSLYNDLKGFAKT
ncbi:MAG: Type I site-specific deoxyribonuclease, HsdR family, partial [Veillonella dispar DORA_11]